MITWQVSEAVPGPSGGDGRGSAAPVQWSRGNGGRPGTIIAAFVRARLFGMQILTLDARVDLVPADRARELPAVAGRASPRTAPRGDNPNVERADLADAVRLLNEGTKALEHVRGLGTL
jgi:hypothetical protein